VKQHPNTNVDIFAVLLNNIPILARNIIYPIINRFVLENGTKPVMKGNNNRGFMIFVSIN